MKYNLFIIINETYFNSAAYNSYYLACTQVKYISFILNICFVTWSFKPSKFIWEQRDVHLALPFHLLLTHLVI